MGAIVGIYVKILVGMLFPVDGFLKELEGFTTKWSIKPPISAHVLVNYSCCLSGLLKELVVTHQCTSLEEIPVYSILIFVETMIFV